ncbi:hypothetical protein QQZ08_009683 [Neonectria magnoliae]|uniref:Transmembrane protein n=1 Tax=Neonectria magnoliae TaxID=2732573 RepID=A0ABR1HLM7_9HYPO
MYTNLSTTSASTLQEPSEPSTTDCSYYKHWAIISTVFAGAIFLAVVLLSAASARQETLASNKEADSNLRIKRLSEALLVAQKRNLDLEKGHVDDELSKATHILSVVAAQLIEVPGDVEESGRDVPQPPRDAPQPRTNEEIRREQRREPTPPPATNVEAMDYARPRNISEEDVVSPKGYRETKDKYREAKRCLQEPRSRELHPIALSTPGRFCSSPEFKGPDDKVVWPFLGESVDDSETDFSSRVSSPSVVVSRRRTLC